MRCPKIFALRFLVSFVFAALLVLSAPIAQAIEYVWKKPLAQGSALVHYNWGNTNYWEPVGLPGANDGASIGGGSCQVVDRVDVKTLTISDAELFGPGPFSVNNLVAANTHFADAVALNYTNYPTGDFRFDFLETGLFTGSINVRAKLGNFGEAVVSNATFTCRPTMYEPASNYVPGWINGQGSKLDLYGSALFRYSSYPMQQYAFFQNELGALIRKKGTNNMRIEWRLDSDGSVTVEGGSLEFQYPKRINGPMTIQAGGVLRFDYSAENLLIDNDASFDGEGRVEFYGGNDQVLVSEVMPINCHAAITNGTFAGEMLLFMRPATWRGVTWRNPIQFFMGGNGAGNVSNSMVNFGVIVDAGINSGPGVTAMNIPPAYYYVSNAFQGSFSYSGTNVARFGWFTNALGATVHFRSGLPNPSLRWNLYNEGVLRFEGTTARFPGGFVQGSSGITELSGQRIGIQSHIDLDGRLTGWGSITSHTARISGTLSPHSSNSVFGRLELHNANNFFVAFPTNEMTMAPETVLEVDLGAPGTTNDFFYITGSNPTRTGIINIRAREGFGPGTFPFFYSASQTLRFGSVPPGYRYSFATNGSTLSIVVTQPELPIAMVHRNANPENGIELILNTLSNLSYKVDYTDDLTQPWQLWTNLTGNGQELVLPVGTNEASRFFKIVEGQEEFDATGPELKR